MLTQDDATRILAQNFAPWVLALKPTVTEVAPGRIVLEIAITPEIARVGAMTCGQALSALADTAMVLATSAHFGKFEPVATTDLHSQFLRPATGTTIRAEAEVVRAGRALLFTRALLSAQPSGKPVATATATFFKP